ncbi:trypsin-like serine peptidase [Actinophytocola xanthii]|uniref:Peptidase n=1 Tax=Actinophytocola xanthii TaxID=1912961 RepID=A0A1Q8BZZ3_9PSEU|nr:peptidase [Actinophytocola xanthii]OLF07682.1 peptidase [Actinophytocola xanthii]
MKRALRRGAAVLVAGGLAMAAAAGPVQARPAPSTVHRAAVTDLEVERVAAYWTPEAMRAAVPLELAIEPGGALAEEPRGIPRAVSPTFPNGGGPWPAGGEVVATSGRVFFTTNGSNASCSGSAVTSANRSTVLTAGHCVKVAGRFHENWVFVPGYENDNAPYGVWPARLTTATPQWLAGEDMNHDLGAAVVAEVDGTSLTDVVGGQGVVFNQERGLDMYAFGWAASPPYDGSTMSYCSGTTFDATLTDGIGMSCDLTRGASGGPWFHQFDPSTGTGLIGSVNSYKINFVPYYVFGPYFGDVARAFYETVQSM